MDKKTQHLETDVWGTAEKFAENGSSVYGLVLAAAQKAREIAKQRNFLDAKTGKINKHPMKPINQALKDIEDELNNESE